MPAFPATQPASVIGSVTELRSTKELMELRSSDSELGRLSRNTCEPHGSPVLRERSPGSKNRTSSVTSNKFNTDTVTTAVNDKTDDKEVDSKQPDNNEISRSPNEVEVRIQDYNPPRATKPDPPWYLFPDLSRSAWRNVTFAVFFVTFIGPTLATYGLFELPLSLNVPLTSVGPIYSIPIVYYVRRERVSWVGWIGAVLTVSGVAVLCSGNY